MNTPFGEMLKKLRAEAGLTQKQLADMSGVGQNTIARYELGQREPSLAAGQALAKALGVSCEVFADVDPPKISEEKSPESEAKTPRKTKKKS